MAATAGLSRCRPCRGGYTLIEMLTTVAVLVIVLGLMVSLARHVRVQSATVLTKDVLARLDAMAAQYQLQNGGAKLPVPGLLDGRGYATAADEADLMHSTRTMNMLLVRFLRSAKLLSAGQGAELPITVYDGTTLRDAWGNPLVYMPTQHPAVGMDPRAGDRGFFFSAGPDGKYLSIKDNLYSYEAWTPEGR